jgi:hypothetical protein
MQGNAAPRSKRRRPGSVDGFIRQPRQVCNGKPKRPAVVGHTHELRLIVGALRNLWRFLALGSGRGHGRQDTPQQEKQRKWLQCLFADLKAVVPDLPDEQRLIIRKVGWDGMTVRQAAEALGLPRATVNDLLWGAARTILARWEGEP